MQEIRITGKNLGSIFASRARLTPEKTACLALSTETAKTRVLTFGQLYYESHYVSNGLAVAGVQPGDRVGVYAGDSLDRSICDLAILGAGAWNVPIHPQASAEQLAATLRKARCSAIFLGNEALLETLLQVRTLVSDDRWPANLILISPNSSHPADRSGDPSLATWGALRELGLEQESRCLGQFERNLAEADPHSPFALIFTTGTGDTLRGALLTHDNMISVLEDADDVIGRYLRPDEKMLSALDPSHALAKVGEFCSYSFGWTRLYSSGNGSEIKLLSPTILFSGPQLFERIYHEAGLGHDEKARASTPLASLLSTLRDNPLAELILPDPLGTAFGGRLRLALCGGGPLSPEISARYADSGIAILEGYGLTETCAPISLNTPDHFLTGSAGMPLPEVSLRTASDGELLIKSRKVFAGYFEDPAETARALQSGWLHTGDAGYVDADGFLHVLGKKDEVITLPDGRKVSPRKLECLSKTYRYYEHFVVFNGPEGTLCALITLRQALLLEYAKTNQILFTHYEDLARHPKILALAQRGIDALNEKTETHERVHKFLVLPSRFTVESGELTPAKNICRPAIARKFKPYLDALFPTPAP